MGEWVNGSWVGTSWPHSSPKYVTTVSASPLERPKPAIEFDVTLLACARCGFLQEPAYMVTSAAGNRVCRSPTACRERRAGR